MISLSLLTDGVMIVALCGAFLGLYRTQKALKALRSGHRDFAQQVGTFNTAILRAQEILGDIKEVANERGKRLQDRIDKAHDLANELDVMMVSGNKLAARLEDGIISKKAKTPKPAEKPATMKPTPKAKAKSKAEQELVKALKVGGTSS